MCSLHIRVFNSHNGICTGSARQPQVRYIREHMQEVSEADSDPHTPTTPLPHPHHTPTTPSPHPYHTHTSGSIEFYEDDGVTNDATKSSFTTVKFVHDGRYSSLHVLLFRAHSSSSHYSSHQLNISVTSRGHRTYLSPQISLPNHFPGRNE